jgi:hypothetical protein
MSRTPLDRSRRISQRESIVLACWSLHMPGDWAAAKGALDCGRMPCDDGALAPGHRVAGTRRFRAAYLTVWGVPARRTDRMDADRQTAARA